MGQISFIQHKAFRLHENPSMHPEKPERLLAIDRAIAQSTIMPSLVNKIPHMADENDLCIIHSPSYIENIEKSSRLANRENKLVQLDEDTFMSPATLEVSKLAVGAGLAAIDSLADENIGSAFVAVRPPGHHAMAERQMGFCIFNNIALAARYARKRFGHRRVLIIDWDVHHGNGTQDIFYDEAEVLFLSMHQYPHWPYQTGWLTEDGKGEGKGFNLNIPLPGGTGDAGHLLAWDSIIAPVSMEYKPDIILVSAGYDAHESDPMSGQQVTTNGFGLMAERLNKLAKQLGVKTACFLEGGYHTHALADSVVATLTALASDDREENKKSESDSLPISEDKAPKELNERLSAVKQHFSQYWSSLS